MRAVVLIAGALLVAAAPYDPRLEVKVDPATPGAPAALSATVTQASGEASTRTERVRFPATFAFNPGLNVARCAAADERAGHCPDASRIGTASARTAFGEFAGPVHLTTDFRFVVFLRGFAGLVQQSVSGYLLLNPDGSVESVLDDLPDVPSTLARIAFESGERSLFLTPRTCGDHVLDAQFTSHDGTRVERKATVRIGGCDSTPRIGRVAVRRTGARRVQVSWQLTDAGSATLVTAARRTRAGDMVRWRPGRTTRAAAARGANRVTLAFPRAGRYQLVLRSLSERGRPVDVARVTVTAS